MSSKEEQEVNAGDVFLCEKCGCELRVLKKGKLVTFTCCGENMKKSQGLNPALSY
jgi:hypothetical protein